MDRLGNKDPETRQMLALVKAHVPKTVEGLIDTCMQAHGAKGFTEDTPLWAAFAGARWLRMADGPDEVHWRTAGKLELQRQRQSPLRSYGAYVPDQRKVFRRSTDPI